MSKNIIRGIFALFIMFAMTGNVMAEQVEAYLGAGVTYGDADCDGRLSRNGVAINSVDHNISAANECDQSPGWQVNTGIDFTTDTNILLGVELGYMMTDFDHSYRTLGLATTAAPDTAVNGGTIRTRGDAEFSSIFYGFRLGTHYADGLLTPYVRLGLHTYEFETSGATVTEPTNSNSASIAGVSQDSTEFYYGLGVEYDVWKTESNAFAIRLDYTKFNIDDFGDLQMFSLTGQYEFSGQ